MGSRGDTKIGEDAAGPVPSSRVTAAKNAKRRRDRAEKGRRTPRRKDQIFCLQDELEKVRRARQRFFWSFSHELRTPLNVILCYNDLLASEILGSLNKEQVLAVTRMAASISQLKQLVEGIFELSEIENRSLPVVTEEVELRALAEDVVAELEPVAAARELYLRVEGETALTAITDGRKLRKILISLCAGALHLTGAGGVTLRLRAEEERARIDVIDTGQGLDEDEWEQIFEEFAQVAHAPRHAGLHLALAYRLALLLGVELDVRSRKGHGSVYSLQLQARLEVAAGA